MAQARSTGDVADASRSTTATTVYGSGRQRCENAAFSIVVTDKVMLARDRRRREGGVRLEGRGQARRRRRVQGGVRDRRRATTSSSATPDYRALLAVARRDGAAPASGLDTTTVDDELLVDGPGLAGQQLPLRERRPRRRRRVSRRSTSATTPRTRRAPSSATRPAGHDPYAEVARRRAGADGAHRRFRKLPELREAFDQIDSAVGVVGGFDGVFGWWGDAPSSSRRAPTARSAAACSSSRRTPRRPSGPFDTLRSFLALARRRVRHRAPRRRPRRHDDHGHRPQRCRGDERRAAARLQGRDRVRGHRRVVVIGYGEAFVETSSMPGRARRSPTTPGSTALARPRRRREHRPDVRRHPRRSASSSSRSSRSMSPAEEWALIRDGDPAVPAPVRRDLSASPRTTAISTGSLRSSRSRSLAPAPSRPQRARARQEERHMAVRIRLTRVGATKQPTLPRRRRRQPQARATAGRSRRSATTTRAPSRSRSTSTPTRRRPGWPRAPSRPTRSLRLFRNAGILPAEK